MPEIKNIAELIETLGGQEKIKSSLKQSLSWIAASFEVTGHQGSSQSRTVLGKWGPPYPETTGYLIPTLLHCDQYHPGLKEIAIKQVSFFESIQNEDGSFYQSIDNKEPIIFDTSQIILGLIALIPYLDHYDSSALKPVVKKALLWLHEQLSNEGIFIDYNYEPHFNPAYYARVSWALAYGESIFQSKISKKTRASVNRILDLQNEHKAFRQAGFTSEEIPYTHTIAYTLRGIWEYGVYTNSKKTRYRVSDSLDRLSNIILAEGKVAGRYDTDWKGDYSFICSTGNAQLALVYLKVYQKVRDPRFLQVVPLLLQPLLENQSALPFNKGGIPSSIPVWGPYQKGKFTNWTQKFYADVLAKLLAQTELPNI